MIKWVIATAVLALASGCAVQTGPEESTGTQGEDLSVIGHSPSDNHGTPIPYMGGSVSVKGPSAPSVTSHAIGHIHIVPLTPDPPPNPEGTGADEPGDAPDGLQHVHGYAQPGSTSPSNGTQHIHIVPLSPDPPPEVGRVEE